MDARTVRRTGLGGRRFDRHLHARSRSVRLRSDRDRLEQRRHDRDADRVPGKASAERHRERHRPRRMAWRRRGVPRKSPLSHGARRVVHRAPCRRRLSASVHGQRDRSRPSGHARRRGLRSPFGAVLHAGRSEQPRAGRNHLRRQAVPVAGRQSQPGRMGQAVGTRPRVLPLDRPRRRQPVRHQRSPPHDARPAMGRATGCMTQSKKVRAGRPSSRAGVLKS
ncbi:hypothetical protein BCEN4_330068 [Burkholderia cenocepacia]|nr:hypothetical protein BCEN4_330068 [Burkholderia cenocepacia]